MADLYGDYILEHALNPNHWGILLPADAEYETNNPLCGDNLRLTVRFDKHERITALGWDGKSCAITLAAASMLGEKILGKTPDELRMIRKQDIFDMLDISLSMNRVNCALLPFKVFTIALYGVEAWEKYEDDAEE